MPYTYVHPTVLGPGSFGKILRVVLKCFKMWEPDIDLFFVFP